MAHEENEIGDNAEDNQPASEVLRLWQRLYELPGGKKNPFEEAGTASKTELQIGGRMPDGTVYAGISPDTCAPMYTEAADAPLALQWEQAMEYAAGLNAHGHEDWRVPTKGELNMLFQNHAAIGGFVSTNLSAPLEQWYWSSSEDNVFSAWAQCLSDGFQTVNSEGNYASLRCVRG